MAEFQSLLLILAAIYLIECGLWIRRGAVAFVSWRGKKWRFEFPGNALGNLRGGLVFANSLPPLGTVFVAEQSLLSVSAEGVYSYSAACLDPFWRPIQSATFISFSDIQKVDAWEKQVLINEKLFLKTTSHFASVQIAKRLRQIHSAPPEKREEEIRAWIRESFDTKKISARLHEFQTTSKSLHFLCHGLLLYVFLIAPVVVWQFGLRHSWMPLLIALFAQTITTALIFRRLHKKLFPKASADRFAPFLTMLLAPSTAARARDSLSRNLLAEFHPLAVARVLGSPEMFRQFARITVRDLRYPLLPECPTSDATCVRTEKWFRERLLETAEKFIEESGVELDSLVKPPKPSESIHHSYCPRCEAQFVLEQGTCQGCGGQTLRRFAKPAATPL